MSNLAFPVGGVIDLGVMRHARSSEAVYFGLVDPVTGFPYTGGALQTNITVTVYFPDATFYVKSTGAPAGTLTLGGAGYYRLALWGESLDDLNQVGTHGMLVQPVTSEFSPVYFQYRVEPEFDVQMAVTYAPGPSNTSLLTGCISIYRWWSHEWLDFPLTATGAALSRSSVISNLSLKITDKDSASNLVNLSGLVTAGGDFAENAFDGNIYFTKAITGITGARVLTARLSFTYHGYSYSKDFTIPSRFGA